MISTLNIKKYLTFLIITLILTLPTTINAQTKNLVNIYFFHSKDCSHCNSEIKFLNAIEEKYNNIKIYRYEVHTEENNQARLAVMDLYNIENNAIPLTIIGDTPYLGYSETSSNLKFIKTIEYYSKYGYHDKVGELLQISILPSFEIKANQPTLDEFLDTYGNYHLIGSLYTNDFDLSSNTTILAILSQINPIQIAVFIIVILIASIKGRSQALIYITSHLLISYLITAHYTITNSLFTLCIALSILIISILLLKFILKSKHQKYLYILILIISILSSTIAHTLYSEPLLIFKELLLLHTQTNLTQISYYSNYLITILMTNIVYILIYLVFHLKLFKLKHNT